MTCRAVILALIGTALLAGVAYFNDQVIKNTYLTNNFLPVATYGALFLFGTAVHPLLVRMRARWALTARELAVVIAAMLIAGFAVGRGFLHHFTASLMLPQRMERTRPDWHGSAPRLRAEDLRDVEGLRAALRSAGARPAGDLAREIAARAPSAAESAGPDALARALNAVIADRSLRTAVREETLPRDLSAHVRNLLARNPADLTDEQAAALNRGLLEAAFRNSVAPRQPAALEWAPPWLLAEPGRDAGAALDAFALGIGEPDRWFSPARIPWAPWRRTLWFWLPLLAAMAAVAIGLALVWHRQWRDHEQLPYPTVEFACALLPGDDGAIGSVLRRRLFWIGFSIVFSIYLANYAHQWWPERVLRVNLQLDFTPLLDLWPAFRRGGPNLLFNPTLYFSVIGVAYFLASDVSLSLGLAGYVFVWIAGTLAGYGIALDGGQHSDGLNPALYAGGYVAFFLAIVYLGRRHLRSVFGRAFGLRIGDPALPHERWGARAAVAGFAVFTALLAGAGVDGPLAVVYAVLLFGTFVVMSRLLAETGAFFLHPTFFPCALLWMGLGSSAFGLGPMTVLGLVSMMLLNGAREALMPLASVSLCLADRAGVRPGRAAALGAVALALAAAIAIPSALYWQYRGGVFANGDNWTTRSVPTFIPARTAMAMRQLAAQGRLELSRARPFRERLRDAALRPSRAAAFGVTFSLALLFLFLRHRFARWPLHPLIFLMLANYSSRTLGFSFLLGWVFKSFVAKYGGARGYQRLKPLAIGLVAGEVMAAFVPMAVGALYHALTGRPPPPFRILPG